MHTPAISSKSVHQKGRRTSTSIASQTAHVAEEDTTTACTDTSVTQTPRAIRGTESDEITHADADGMTTSGSPIGRPLNMSSLNLSPIKSPEVNAHTTKHDERDVIDSSYKHTPAHTPAHTPTHTHTCATSKITSAAPPLFVKSLTATSSAEKKTPPNNRNISGAKNKKTSAGGNERDSDSDGFNLIEGLDVFGIFAGNEETRHSRSRDSGSSRVPVPILDSFFAGLRADKAQ